MDDCMNTSLLKCRIERLVTTSRRGVRSASFTIENELSGCAVWFEKGKPKLQVRTEAMTLEEAATVGVAIQMAIDWAVEEMARPEFKAAKL